MMDRLGNVANMLYKARSLRDQAEHGSEEKHYFERECYKWENELMSNGINPSDIESYDFFIQHQFNGFK